MGLKVEPAYIGQTGYLHPVELDRNLLEGIFSRTGGMRLGDFQASTGVGTRAVAISAGRAFLLGAENAQQGGYVAWSDATETFLLAAGVGNPRIDTIVLRVIDDQYGSISGSPRAEFEVVQGVAAASPTARVDSDFNVGGSFYKPGAWWRVADCRVNVGDTTIPSGQITTNNRYVRVPGGKVMCLSTSRPSDPLLGDRIQEIDTGLAYDYDGSAWVLDGLFYRKTQRLIADAASMTFSNIPSTITKLEVLFRAKSSDNTTPRYLVMRIDGNSTANYYDQVAYWIGTTPTVQVFTAQTYNRVGFIHGTSATDAANFSSGHGVITGWDNHSSDQSVHHSFKSGGLSGATSHQLLAAGTYAVNASHTSLVFLTDVGNLKAGTEITVRAVS